MDKGPRPIFCDSFKDLNARLIKMSKTQLIYCIHHFMREMEEQGETLFDLTWEAKVLCGKFDKGEIPRKSTGLNSSISLAYFVYNMDSSGFWLAKARSIVVRMAFEETRTSEEVLEATKSIVEGSRVDNYDVARKLVSSILRLAGFQNKVTTRGENRLRVWKLINSSDDFMICHNRMENEINNCKNPQLIQQGG